MDDKNFDDVIRRRLETYEDPDFDPSALVSFQERLSAYPSMPWYSRYRTEGFLCALIIFTLLNGFFVLHDVNKKEKNAAALTGPLKDQVDSLNRIIFQLKTAQRPSVFILDPSRQKTKSSGENTPNESQSTSRSSRNYSLIGTDSKLYLGTLESLPPNVVARLLEDSVLETKDGEAYLILSDKIKRIRNTSFAYSSDELKIRAQKEVELTDEKVKKLMGAASASEHKLSRKMINAIEAHAYVKGIGINVTPHLDFVQGIFSKAQGGMTPRLGLGAEWIVAPHWSVETSVNYLSTSLKVSGNFQSLNLTDPSPELGAIQSVELNTRTLSSPISVNYRWWLTREHLFVVKAGYTPYFSLNRQYLYRHPYPGRPAGSDRTISTLEHSDDVKFYGNTLTLTLGLVKKTKKKSQFEADLFYERSLGTVGNEKLGMQLFGIRSAFSFRIK